VNSHAIDKVIAEILAASALPFDESMPATMRSWAGALSEAIAPNRKQDTLEGLRWDFDRLLEQRNEIVSDFNAAKRRIDELVNADCSRSVA
jgi:hypothetical protein